jgi:hypothetical protein
LKEVTTKMKPHTLPNARRETQGIDPTHEKPKPELAKRGSIQCNVQGGTTE